MTTAYTSLLGLALPVTGELSGTWGDTVNNYITQYLDAAVAGAQTISGTQTAVTLSTTNGTSLSQAGTGGTGSAQYTIINCTGSPASLLTITVPATSKVYLVLNATSTSQSVAVVGAGPTTGVTILAGEKALIAWNGSDFVKVATASGAATFSSVTVTGLTASQAVFTDASKNLVSNAITGTGNVVMSASPTLTGTITASAITASGTLTASAAVTFSGTTTALSLGTSQTTGTWTAGGTAQTGAMTLGRSTGAQTVNIATGATTSGTTKTVNIGTAGVSGSTTAINIGSAVSGATNTITISGNPTFSGGTANGVLYLDGSKVATSGTAVTYDGSTFVAPNLQFGSSSNLLYQSAAQTAALRVGTTPAYLNFTNSTGTPLIDAPSGTLLLGISGTEKMRINSSGIVSIGTSNTLANSYLTVSQGVVARTEAASGVTPYLQLYNGNAGTDLKTLRIGGTSTGAMAFETVNDAYSSSSEKMRLDSSGNLGVGVTPSAWLSGAKAIQIGAGGYVDSRGSVNLDIGSNAYIDSAAAWRYISTGAATQTRMDSGAFAWLIAASGTAGNTISWTQAMTLDASGNLGIGTSSPSQKLSVATTSGNCYVEVARASKSTGQVALQLTGGTSGTNWIIYQPTNSDNLTFFGNSADRMVIDSSGNLGIGTSSPGKNLQIGNGAVASYMIRFSGSLATFDVGTTANGMEFTTPNNQGYIWTNNANERMRLDSSGNLGIGTSGPLGKLDVVGTGSAAAANWIYLGRAANVGATNPSATFTSGFAFGTNFSNGSSDSNLVWGQGIGSGQYLSISKWNGTTVSEQMRLDSSGNVQIGTTTSNGRLSVDQGSTGTAGYFTTSGSTGTIILSDTGGNGAGIKFVGNGATTPNKYIRTNAGVLEFVNSAYSAVFANFTDAGAAYNTTGTWGTISDLRIKENISDARNYLADLCRLRVVKYSLKSEKATSATKLGFIAQEVEEVFPKLVETSKNEFEGLDDMKQIKMSVLTPMLLKAVQELKAELDAVKAELATLKGA